MSFLSSMFTRAKGAIVAGVSMVPLVGGIAARAVEGIHTGDEHQDAAGNWVNNSDGQLTIQPPSIAMQLEIDRVNRFNAEEIARVRQAAADAAVRLGGGATVSIASALDPDFLKRNAITVAGVVTVLGLVLFIVMKKK